jgi:dTDP-4-dehydrorhamnose reductase
MVIVVTGATGFLGSHIVERINSSTKYKCFSLGFNNIPKINGFQLNLTDKKKVFELFNKINPDLIIHTAALTDVDHCEKNLLNAYNLNVQATKNLAEWTSSQHKNIRFVYISTDQVYNNFQSSASEKDINPVNFYGMSKLWAEDIVSSLENYLILRTNFFSFEGGLIKWLLDANSLGQEITLFDNIWFNPIYIPDFIDTLMKLFKCNNNGVFNIGVRGEGITKADFLEMIIMKFRLNNIRAIRSNYNKTMLLIAERPSNMTMSTKKFEDSFAFNLPSIDESVNRMLTDYNNLNYHE